MLKISDPTLCELVTIRLAFIWESWNEDLARADEFESLQKMLDRVKSDEEITAN
jgi:hypothetical protein